MITYNRSLPRAILGATVRDVNIRIANAQACAIKKPGPGGTERDGIHEFIFSVCESACSLADNDTASVAFTVLSQQRLLFLDQSIQIRFQFVQYFVGISMLRHLSFAQCRSNAVHLAVELLDGLE